MFSDPEFTYQLPQELFTQPCATIVHPFSCIFTQPNLIVTLNRYITNATERNSRNIQTKATTQRFNYHMRERTHPRVDLGLWSIYSSICFYVLCLQ